MNDSLAGFNLKNIYLELNSHICFTVMMFGDVSRSIMPKKCYNSVIIDYNTIGTYML